MTPKDWFKQGRIEKINGFDIFITDNENIDVETILLIHGFPTSSWDWHAISLMLGKKYRLVSLDMLGFGFSQKPAKHHYTIHQQADIVEGVIEHLGLSTYHVLAHDYGDTVAQELLARQNEGTGSGVWQSCCFLNGGLFPEMHRPLLIQKLLLSPVGFIVNNMMTKAKFSASMSKVFGRDTQPSQNDLNAFWELIEYNNGRQAFHRLIHYMNDRVQHRDRWRDALKHTHISLALINGSADPISGKHMVEYYIEHIGAPTYLAQLDTIGHYPQVEDAKSVATHYLKFLNNPPSISK